MFWKKKNKPVNGKMSVYDYFDNPISDGVKAAGAEVLGDQKWFNQRKNSLASSAQTVLQVLNLVAFSLGDVHWGVTLALAVAIGLAEVVFHASTDGAVTPSVVEKMRLAAQKQDHEVIVGPSVRKPAVPEPEPAPAVPAPQLSLEELRSRLSTPRAE